MPITLTGGNFRDPQGNQVNGKLLLKLSGDAKLIAGGQICPIKQSFVISAGNVTGNPSIYGTDELNPSGLSYIATAIDANNNNIYGPENWQPSGGGTLDLGTIAPAQNTGTSVAILFATGISTVTYSASPQFNAASNNVFSILLTGSVTAPTVVNAVAGQILLFQIKQDNAGGHPFTWPAGFNGAMTISQDSNAVNSQAFYYDGTNYYAWTVGTIN